MTDFMEESSDNIITLQDENGKDVQFEHLMTVELDGSYYVVLEALESGDDCMEGESIILKIIRDENSDEDVYATIEDEEEYNRVADRVMEIVEEEEEEGAEYGTYEEGDE